MNPFTFQTPSERAVRRWQKSNDISMEVVGVSNPFRAGGEALNWPLLISSIIGFMFQTPSERAVRRCDMTITMEGRPAHVSNPFRAGGEALTTISRNA